MPGADLFHFDAHLESCGEHFDELPEVYPLICDVIEDGFISVSLVFDISDFHFESEGERDLSAFDHGFVLERFGFSEFVHVYGPGMSVDSFELEVGLEVCFFDLQGHEPSGHSDGSDVVSWVGFHGYDVSLLQVEVVGVDEVAFAWWLELHFDELACLFVVGQVGEVVVGVELIEMSCAAFLAELAASALTVSECGHNRWVYMACSINSVWLS